jgi:hypothetical protein
MLPLYTYSAQGKTALALGYEDHNMYHLKIYERRDDVPSNPQNHTNLYNNATTSTRGRCITSSSILWLSHRVLNLLSIHLGHVNTRSLNVVAELLFMLAQLRDHLAMGMPHGLDLKQLVHALERDTLGFRDEEVHEDDRENHQRRKKEVHAVSHGCEHLRREARDEEIPEPV